jgi:serine/threonine protein kinase/predicted negative regulator of RcsB-dependent stress response
MKCPKCHFENPDDTLYCGKCAAPLQPSEEIDISYTKTLQISIKELPVGSTFAGRYQVLEELGKGGMGKVYKVEDNEIKENVALKLLNPEVASDEKTIERFRNELKFARKITHKNVCRMYHLSKEEDSYYITMEYVSGEDLKSLIKRIGQFTPGKAVAIAKQVGEGLSEAHGLGVVHRDLKPQNIMIDKEGNVRIMDFGIARSVEARGVTQAGTIVGTPDYMSPEQVEGKEADQRSDIYSIGVILYEMMTGKVPFEGDTALSVALKHKTETPPDPRSINPQLPSDLSRMLLRCMEKDRERRYQTVDELLSDLSNVEKGIPTAERVLPRIKLVPSKEITVQFRLKKLLIPAIMVIALLIIGVVIWRRLPRKEAVPLAPPGKPSIAIMYFKNNTGDESLDYLRSGLSDLLISDMLQSKYIHVMSGDRLFKILEDLNKLEEKSYSSDVLKQVAARGGVNHILQGNYAKAGDAFRINVMLQKAKTGELIASEGIEGMGEASMFSMVDELTRRIKSHFKLSEEEIAEDIDKLVGKITTSSPEAYRYYIEGKKLAYKGENRQALEFYKKAVAVDPEFASAYRAMSMICFNLRLYSEAGKYIIMAFKLIDKERVSDRESLLIKINYYLPSEKTVAKSFEAFNELLEVYPESRDNDIRGARNIIGMIYSGLEEWGKAIEQFEWLIQNRYEGYQPYVNITNPYRAKGLYDKARKVIQDYHKNFKELPITHWELAVNYLCQGKYDLALAETDKSLSLEPAFYRNFFTRGDVYLCEGKLVEAEKEYQRLLALDDRSARFYFWRGLGVLYLLKGQFEKSKDQLKQGIESAKIVGDMMWKSDFDERLTYTHLKSGDHEEALKECDNLWKFGVGLGRSKIQIRALFLKGLTFLEINSIEEAQKAADQIMASIQKGLSKKHIRFYHHLMGKIELKRENFSKAFENFKQALSYMPYQKYQDNDHALFIDSLASAYYQAGDKEKALEEYEKIISLTVGRLYYGDICAKSFYMLGRICEDKGWKGKAIEHYQKFLDLWNNADSGITEIEDAERRLAELQSK